MPDYRHDILGPNGLSKASETFTMKHTCDKKGGGGTTRGAVFVHPILNEDKEHELDLTWNEINTALENGSMVYLELIESDNESFYKMYCALLTIVNQPMGYMVTFDGTDPNNPSGPYTSDSPDGVLAERK